MERTGGRNPLVDLAQEITLTKQASSREIAPDELDEVRGEQTGFYSGEGPLPQPPPPNGDGSGQADPPKGTFESFMRLFGDGGTPGPHQR